MAKTIDRISRPSIRVFKEYLYSNEPVIIENLFIESKLSAIDSPQKLCDYLGEVRLEAVEEYSQRFSESGTFVQESHRWTVTEYLKYAEENPSGLKCLREFDTPEQLTNLLEVPALCTFNNSVEVTSNFFLSRGGLNAHLHFDADYRNVLLYQGFGRKQAILISPIDSQKLLPVLNQSWVRFEGMCAEELGNFLNYINAYEAILSPGDTLFFPAFMWHQFNYLDFGMSINLRFGRSNFSRFLARKFHCDEYIQRLGYYATSGKLSNSDLQSIGNSLNAARNAPDLEPFDIYKNVSAKAMEMCLFYGQNNSHSCYLPYNGAIVEHYKSLKELASNSYTRSH